MTHLPADSGIARLRRIVAALDGAELPSVNDRAWLVAAVRRYETEAPNGWTLDRALGLAPMTPGQETWWTREAREKRDRAIRTIATNFCADLRITRAARQIAKDGAAYQASTWRHDRSRAHLALTDPKKRLLAEALSTGLPFPKARRIEDILRNEFPASDT